MTYEQAINIIGQAEFKTNHDADYAIDVVDAITIAMQTMEKQIPTKPIETDDNGTGTICPNCGETLLTNWKPNHCMHCSQAIDWSKE